MITDSFDRIATETTHDHGVTCAGPLARARGVGVGRGGWPG
jgi:hypothetical protein